MTAQNSSQSTATLHDLIDQGAQIISESGWQHFSLHQLAQEAGCPDHEIYGKIPSKEAFLSFFSQRITTMTLETVDLDGLDSPRDILFEVMMSRLDQLTPYKGCLQQLEGELWSDPRSLLTFLPKMAEAFEWMLSLAGFSTSGLKGLIKIQAFGVFYGLVVHQWLREDTVDLSRTLKALDQNLDRFMPVFEM